MVSLDLCQTSLKYMAAEIKPAWSNKSWIVNSRAIAKKVRNATRSSSQLIKDCGANRECPNCHYCIDNSDFVLVQVSQEWPGLPVGVKFDPSDVELVQHLAAKCGVGDSKPHMFIDEFIPTLEGDQGICYTHPENLPGAKKDGSSVHFFHRTMNAYSTGQRKRRKIHNQHSLTEDHARWHKTGKTKAVIQNGVQKGCKKIMVLYKSSKKGSKPDKANWVMQQYHLGTDEDEKDGEYVVSKIYYQQPKQNEKAEDCPVIEDSDNLALETSPRTPNTNPPIPPRPEKSLTCDNAADGNILTSPVKAPEHIVEASSAPLPSAVKPEDHLGSITWLAGESQDVDYPDLNSIEESLLCKEENISSALLENSGINNVSYTDLWYDTNNMKGNNSAPCGISDLENLELDTPPDFQLTFSGESILDWLDRF
ncbi:SUPPRESSOR OF GAMMA RESPONSE 1-like isoform X2 [Pistacia vera]|uniref:SUPPRESSOR OF GAMMA RESPONSE 1-like isoform X2 n=1 Tax=Pistacia vera TaxID=55513 RepID=UPI001263A099|nr:SUPPRESSOR OF GAMMA RESPONSE 1-like isoform X2 [Pistacia vera]XP_031260205.1 SUPPRESSOR OF GAMMA RESPONSE 1-like isoform X2 [Pistacia vera]